MNGLTTNANTKRHLPHLVVLAVLIGLGLGRRRPGTQSGTNPSVDEVESPQLYAHQHHNEADVRLLKRIEDSFHGAYFTLLSIVQGVALGYLVHTFHNEWPIDRTSEWITFVLTGALIAILWQEYLVGATAFAWVPTVFDVIVPFALGILESVVIATNTVSLPMILLSCALRTSAGVIAYANYYWQSQRGLGDSRRNSILFRRFQKSGFLTLTIAPIWYFALWLWARDGVSPRAEVFVALMCWPLPVAMFARLPLFWNRVICKLGASMPTGSERRAPSAR